MRYEIYEPADVLELRHVVDDIIQVGRRELTKRLTIFEEGSDRKKYMKLRDLEKFGSQGLIRLGVSIQDRFSSPNHLF